MNGHKLTDAGVVANDSDAVFALELEVLGNVAHYCSRVDVAVVAYSCSRVDHGITVDNCAVAYHYILVDGDKGTYLHVLAYQCVLAHTCEWGNIHRVQLFYLFLMICAINSTSLTIFSPTKA